MPGLPAKYPGGAVSIEVSIGEVPALIIDTVSISTQWPLQFAFSVVPEGGSEPVMAFEFVANSNLTLALGLNTTGNGTLVVTGTVDFLGADIEAGNRCDCVLPGWEQVL